MALLDAARGDDRHTAERLTAEPVIWLGTVRPDGRPHNVPVWFAWHDPLVLIFSMPNTAKVRNVRASPAVSLSQPLLIHVQRITAWTRTATGVAYRVVP
jgi:PPOX class probable F420-dependent enzyme